jgi:ABC-type antimicrobial peptide transport system permease subunit
VPATIYVPLYQELPRQVNFTVRIAGNPEIVSSAIRRAVHEIDSQVPLFDLRTQEEQVSQIVSEERLFAVLSVFFGGVALLLTCIGLYGLLANQVAARTREFGIRMALGAQVRAVLALVLRDGLRLALVGVLLGLATALILTRFVSRLLFEVHPMDPATLVGASVLLIVVALVACWLPARRATKVAPMVALRCE